MSRLTPVERYMATRLHDATVPIFTASPACAEALRALARMGLAQVEAGAGMATGLTFARPTGQLARDYLELVT